ncbi:MAG: zeta toxin family protein [Candidatus Eisenbacteria bacterium]|uniref:Zeta toxin family protein n=1 Tax=Eiseniibacteriota bacterium TaxID=2212470 RepID=A0A9D6QPX0_UNCEI|nr:zeta toxin family protein [Candidatus Eisenbacteria bacterium]MBI3540339.1 zeta toxin family protein [Candidatus Eisenbacteria bacterium]
MAPRTSLVVVLAGPNGAGKSTSAPHLLRGALAVEEFVNADTIAQGLSAYRPEAAAVAAGRVMLERLRFVARERRDFAFETTLAGRGHARWLRELRSSGYRVHLIFLSLPAPELAIARVLERVRRGGHHVPDDVVRRRFRAGLRNLLTCYAMEVDSWQVYDNAELGGPRLIASQAAGAPPVIANTTAWDNLKEPR